MNENFVLVFLLIFVQVLEECGDKVVRITCWPCFNGVQQLCSKSPRLSPSRECRRPVSRWTAAPDLRCLSIWVRWKWNSSALIRQTSASCAKLARPSTAQKPLWCNTNGAAARRRPNHRRLPAAEPLDWCSCNTSAWCTPLICFDECLSISFPLLLIWYFCFWTGIIPPNSVCHFPASILIKLKLINYYYYFFFPTRKNCVVVFEFILSFVRWWGSIYYNVMDADCSFCRIYRGFWQYKKLVNPSVSFSVHF